jgi:16S rRNA (cytosine967-C5)-methyltransferase
LLTCAGSLLGVIRIKPRQIAIQILRQAAQSTDYVEHHLAAALQQYALAPPDRRLVQELVFGPIRWQATLDWLIAQKTQGRTQKPLLQLLLRQGLYQMFWLDRIPTYAILHETVDLAKQLGCGPQAGFINAVLREYSRTQAATQDLLAKLRTEQPSLGYSHPAWLCERWQDRWGADNLIKLLDWNNTPAPVYARVNQLKTDAAQLEAQWEKEGVKFRPAPHAWTEKDSVFVLEGLSALAELPSFQQGFFYVQDPSTLLAVSLLDPQPGQWVLDQCAAPGGKTALIAQRMNNAGRIVAQDNQPERLKLLHENCARLGVTCVETQTMLNLQTSPSAGFDRILTDVPCSNTGVLRRRVELRWRLHPGELPRLARQQLEILRRSAVPLKPGVILVYSTCSLEPEENSEVVHRFLAESPEFGLETERALVPFRDQVDGAYVARLKRSMPG